YVILISKGDTINWTNDDSTAHTVTSGDRINGPDGKFESSLFAAGTTFSHKFDEKDSLPYFCLVHPWMKGFVLVT
ncbi:MAG: plastocyanin/azurin family copper-binding protein, partial [Nitrosopumilaceae archaeon]